MDALYNQVLHRLDKAFRKLEGMVPPPQKESQGDGFVFRYREKTIHQAILQKLARVVSGLHAARLLFQHGFVQEQAPKRGDALRLRGTFETARFYYLLAKFLGNLKGDTVSGIKSGWQTSTCPLIAKGASP